MKFNILKSRRGKLGIKIWSEVKEKEPSLERILTYIDEYQRDNLDTIDKLKKSKTITLKRINGGLKQAIDAHGPVTKLLIGSASKRIFGALVNHSEPKSDKKEISVFQWLILLFELALIISVITLALR
jgi:hypothetical protein